MPWWAWGKCTKPRVDDITCLDFNHLSLTEVPTEIFAFERTLEDLFLESNRIVDLPRQLFHCHGLKTLNLSDNEIASIPSAISALENLQWLDLSRNVLTKLPETIKSCSNLIHLNISLNPIEKLCDSLTSIHSLSELYLNDIYLEFLPANFGRLVNLKILELRENILITLPKSMARLVNLQRLDIGQNDFSELPEVVTNLTNLTELWIDMNRIRRLPARIGQLRKLVHFDASHNCLGSLPRDIGYWTKIVEFCVAYNYIDDVPSTIGNMKNLIGLKLNDNRIQTLPDNIGKLLNLEELILAENKLIQLPETVGLLRKLQVLTVDKNNLTSIPIEIGSCISLRIFTLRSNKISYIPAELGHLSSLRVLNLINNELQELPVSLLKLDKLAALWLSDNQSQPLIPLQQDYDVETSHMYLTCFMLPQINSEANENDKSLRRKRNVDHVQRPDPRRHICFSADAAVFEQPRRLSRAPTPYPKELRALARHARLMNRNMFLDPTNSTNMEDIEMDPGKLTSDVIEIKEAKVTMKDEISSPISEDFHHLNPDHSVLVNDSHAVSLDQVPPELSMIREAKYVRTYEISDVRKSPIEKSNDSVYDRPPVSSFVNSDSVQNHHEVDSTPPKRIPPPPPGAPPSQPHPGPPNGPSQPPPYSIAAAHSLHAEYFNNYHHKMNHKSNSPESIYDFKQPVSYQNYVNHFDYSTPIVNSINDNVSIHSIEINQKMLVQNQGNFSGEKPPTFIQDKPVAGQNIVAPTPQRLHPLGNEPPPLGNQNAINYENRYDNANMGEKNSNWLFGQHKNVSVVQIVIKKNPNLGFSIFEDFNNGIFVSNVIVNGPAYNKLKPGDKILYVDNVDFNKINLDFANQILQNTGPEVTIMISRST